MSVCLAFFRSNFREKKLIAMKFFCVKLNRFAHKTKNSHCVINNFFTSTRQKFEHVIIHYFDKTSRVATKIGYVFRGGNISAHAKNNHCIIQRFYRDASKVWWYYHPLFHKMFRSSSKFGCFTMVRRISLYLNISHCIIHKFFYRILSKIWLHFC